MCRLNLIPRALPSDWQTHSMPPASVRSGVSESLDILQDLPSKVVVDLHTIQMPGQLLDLILG